MKSHKKLVFSVIGVLLVCISLCILPVSGNPAAEKTQTYSMTIVTEFDGTHYLVKDGDSGEVLKTLTPKEFEKEIADINAKLRVEGPDTTGMMTFYDRGTGAVVGTGYGKKTP